MSNENTMNPPEPTPIPIPPDFPVTWENPDDAHIFWQHDRMHFPDPALPLEGQFWALSMGKLNMEAVYNAPTNTRFLHVNTYLYLAWAPRFPLEEMEVQGKLYEEKLNAAIAKLEELWDTEWLPEIKTHLAFWDAFDLREAGVPELLIHLDETFDRMIRLWEIHFLTVFPALMAIGQFDELYQDLFGSEDTFASYKLLQGFDNKTVETGREQWALSRRALASDEVRQTLETHAASEVIKALEATSAGQKFLVELRAYLEAYGQRGDKWGVSYPYWIEDPTPVIKNLKDYITQPERDATAELAELAAERTQAMAKARERLKGYPQQVVEQFEFLLKAAQIGNVLTEDHGFWIDFNCLYRVRRVFMEFGRRCAEADVIETPNDIFYLTLDELRETARALPAGNQRALIDERRAEMEHFRTINPPSALGTDYGPPPESAFGRVMQKFAGGPPQPSDEPNVIRGNSGSPGKTRGPAKVIRSIAEADKLHAGDILVAETTAPPWTPLFATAAAVVTDTGGILSHCAVVAREYRIPAVVGTGTATSLIQDGQILEVDGDEGIVRIVEE